MFQQTLNWKGFEMHIQGKVSITLSKPYPHLLQDSEDVFLYMNPITFKYTTRNILVNRNVKSSYTYDI